MSALSSAPALPLRTLVILFQLLPFAISLAIGKWLSSESRWQLDAGVVFLCGAIAGAAFAIVISAMFANPEFQKRLSHPRPIAMDDYLFAAIWLGAWAILGVALLLGARKGASDHRAMREHVK